MYINVIYVWWKYASIRSVVRLLCALPSVCTGDYDVEKLVVGTRILSSLLHCCNIHGWRLQRFRGNYFSLRAAYVWPSWPRLRRRCTTVTFNFITSPRGDAIRLVSRHYHKYLILIIAKRIRWWIRKLWLHAITIVLLHQRWNTRTRALISLTAFM